MAGATALVMQNELPPNEESTIEYLAGLIRDRTFDLEEGTLMYIEREGSELLRGWVFAYRVHRASDGERIECLRKGLTSTNPRIREQSCDIIGDEDISALRQDLVRLFVDPADCAREAAIYNHDKMF